MNEIVPALKFTTTMNKSISTVLRATCRDKRLDFTNFRSPGLLLRTFSELRTVNSLRRPILRRPVVLARSQNLFFPQRYFQSEAEYSHVADETLEDIQDWIEEALDGVAEEVNYASGVLTVQVPVGTWVLNKQTPNRQIWWSSPISGPKRFEYENDEWVCSREGVELETLLKKEFSIE